MLKKIIYSLLILSFVLPSFSQNLPVKGTDATLDIATWNLEHFGGSNGPSDDEKQLQNAITVMRAAELDIWAVQEIKNETMFNRLVDSLGGSWRGSLSTNTLGSVTQRVAYVYNSDVIEVVEFKRILLSKSEGSGNAFAYRPPYLLKANVHLNDNTYALTLITVHMKCCGDSDDYARRLEASNALKDYMDFVLPGSARIILLGDMNDELGSSIAGGRTSPYQNFKDDTDDYTIRTKIMDQNNTPTYCGNTSCTSGSTLDHIIVSDNLEDNYILDTTETYEEVVDEISGYSSTTSDHLPVMARFDLSQGNVANESDLPNTDSFSLSAAYPNPFIGQTTVTFSVTQTQAVKLVVVDAMGREVSTLFDTVVSAGEQKVTFDGTNLSSGLYFCYLKTETGTAVQALVIK